MSKGSKGSKAEYIKARFVKEVRSNGEYIKARFAKEVRR